MRAQVVRQSRVCAARCQLVQGIVQRRHEPLLVPEVAKEAMQAQERARIVAALDGARLQLAGQRILDRDRLALLVNPAQIAEPARRRRG